MKHLRAKTWCNDCPHLSVEGDCELGIKNEVVDKSWWNFSVKVVDVKGCRAARQNWSDLLCAKGVRE